MAMIKLAIAIAIAIATAIELWYSHSVDRQKKNRMTGGVHPGCVHGIKNGSLLSISTIKNQFVGLQSLRTERAGILYKL